MAEIGRWNGHIFEVSSNVVRGWTGLTVKGTIETTDKTKSKEMYVVRKQSKPTEISLSVHLHASLGCDVRTEAFAFIDEARAGALDYFYIGEEKLVPYQLLLTEASIKEAKLFADGTWSSAEVKLTLKQGEIVTVKKTTTTSASSSSSSSSSGSGSKKVSVKSTSTTTTTKDKVQTTNSASTSSNSGSGIITKAATAVAKSVTTTAAKLVTAVKSVVSTAKTTSASKSTSSSSSNSTTTASKVKIAGKASTVSKTVTTKK